MSEVKALILAFLALAVPAGVTAVVIAITNAGGAALGLAIVFFAGLGGYISSLIVMHYGELEERKKREEIILSR
jgi:hypothetical protein